MTTTHTIKCAKCNVPVEVATENDTEIARCPVCGLSDTKENAYREVKEYVTRQASDALSASMERIAHDSKFMTYKQGPRDHKVYRFVVDYRPEL